MTISLNPTENLFDPSINKQNYSSISLSVQLSLNYLSFSIIDNSQNKFLAIVNYTFPEKASPYKLAEFLTKLFEYENLLKKDFKNIIISYETIQSTLIPEELFDSNQLETYLKFQFTDIEDKSILHNFIENQKIYSVFAIPTCIYTVFQNNLSNYKIIHSAHSFIESIYKNFNSQSNFNNKIFVDIDNYSFGMLIFRNNKLLLNNNYGFKTKEDFIYYLLYTLKQLNIDIQSINLVLSGKIAINSSIFNLLSRYISNISFIENKSYFTFSDALAKTPSHQYYKLLNQILSI